MLDLARLVQEMRGRSARLVFRERFGLLHRRQSPDLDAGGIERGGELEFSLWAAFPRAY